MKSNRGYLPVDAFFPFEGLDTMTPPSQLPAGGSPNVVNMTTFRGTLKKRSGYAQYGNTINSGAESIFKVLNFQRADGTNLGIALTGTKQYYNASGTWTDVTTVGTKVTLPKAGWAISAGAFTVGDFVKQTTSGAIGQWLTPDGSNYYVWKVSGTFDATHTIITVPSQNAASPGTLTPTATTAVAASATIPWSGTEDNWIDVAEIVDVNLGRLLIMTNGKDWPIYWDGLASTTFKPLPINIANFCTCQCVGVFNSYLVLGNIRTNVDHNPRTVYWCDTGDVADWLTGNSGLLTEISLMGELLRLIPFNDQLIAFSRNSIGCICYVDPTVIFGSKIYITNTYLTSPGAVDSIGESLLYVGRDNIHSWSGGSFIRSMGDKVTPLWRSLQTSSNTYLGRTRLFYDKSAGILRFIMPTGSTTSRVLIMDLEPSVNMQVFDKPRWFEEVYATRMVSVGNIESATPSQPYTYPIIGTTGGKVHLDDGQANDDGTAIAITYETLDYCMPEKYQSQMGRWLEFEWEASGSAIVVSYSTDHGSSWTALASQTLTGALTRYKSLIDVTSRFIRFKFTSSATGSTFVLAWFRVWFRAGGSL